MITRKHISSVPAVILSILLVFAAFGCDGNNSTGSYTVSFTIISPYSGVNWETFGQYKAALHVHTTRSDGGNTLAQMVEVHYEQGFDILAITDHNVLNESWITGSGALTPERYAIITAGTDRGGRGMLRIPAANEQGRGSGANAIHHLNTFFAPFNNPTGLPVGFEGLRRNVAAAQELGGFSRVNHPGRYTGGMAGGEAGAAASNNPATIQQYVDLFMEFPPETLIGMEIINKADGESVSDRILWDNILKQTMPERPVWGFSDDDSHGVNAVGYSFNMFVMERNDLDNFKSAIVNGNFYAVARAARRELGQTFLGRGPTPVITNIAVNERATTITITAENIHRIDWIADGVMIARGSTLRLKDHKEQIGSYVRANLIGPGGIAFTQPFGIILNQ